MQTQGPRLLQFRKPVSVISIDSGRSAENPPDGNPPAVGKVKRKTSVNQYFPQSFLGQFVRGRRSVRRIGRANNVLEGVIEDEIRNWMISRGFLADDRRAA